MIAELPAKEASDVRLVLRHRPLSFHDWARKAAMMSICVEAQDEGAFWKLPGFLFSHQAQLTATNLEPQLLQFAKEDLHLNSEAITACMDRRGYENALEIDDHLAVQFGIHETPTVFVNGRRYAGFRSSDDLKRAINDALIEARRGRISSQIPAKR
jgi:protein-disulfide isomerase